MTDLTEGELAAAIKACDIHRQSLAKRLPNVDADHRGSMLSEIRDTTTAAAKLKAAQSGRFQEVFGGSQA